MDYFSILDLEREPFSNSPDPAFFYQSAQHTACLQQLELAIRLRRGLNVVIGHVGTGKTTLCREIIRRLDDDDTISTCLLLDPGMHSDSVFLSAVVEQLTGQLPSEDWPEDRKKEAIKQILFEKGVAENHTTALIIDEGQKIAPSCLEILREFLNYETNTHKLLQIVIFAQKEFDQIITDTPNFADRINLRLEMNPLGFRETMALIHFRIQVAGGGPAGRLFSAPAMAAIFLITQGYPRRIIHLCHRVLLTLIIQNRRCAGWRLVRASARRTAVYHSLRPWRWTATIAALILIAAFGLVMNDGGLFGFFTNAPPIAQTAPDALSVNSPPVAPRPHALEAKRSDPDILSPSRPFISDAVAAANTVTAFAAESPSPIKTSVPVDITPATMPARLGRLTIHPGETLGQLIHIIYGQFTPTYLDAIVQANPHITNPDTLNVGDIVHFPALPAAVRPLPVNIWWVEVASCPRLDDAVRTLKRFGKNHIPARLVPYWNPEHGLVFSIVLTDCFYDRHVAENAMNRSVLASEPETAIRSLWRDDTVFFCDPFRPVSAITANPS
jgi:general secretion pathway protein A